MIVIKDHPEIVLQRMLLKGSIEHELSDRLLNSLKKIISVPSYRNLFQDTKTILREQSILLGENENKRPDLILIKDKETIVLDYKTGMKNSKHLSQAKQYVKVMQQMHLPEVKGYVYYTAEGELLEV